MSLIGKLTLPHSVRPSRSSSKSAIIYLHGLAGAEHHAGRLEEKYGNIMWWFFIAISARLAAVHRFPGYGSAVQNWNIITPRGIFFHEKQKDKNTYKWFDVSFATDPPTINEENFHESRKVLSQFVSEVTSIILLQLLTCLGDRRVSLRLFSNIRNGYVSSWVFRIINTCLLLIKKILYFFQDFPKVLLWGSLWLLRNWKHLEV